MSVKTDSELTSLNNSRLPDNNVRYISAERVRNQIQDVIDSKFSNQGGLSVVEEGGYSTLLDLSAADPKTFVHKQYVDDAVAAGGGGGIITQEIWQDSSLNKYKVTIGLDGTFNIEGVVSGATAVTSRVWQDANGTDYLQTMGIDGTFNITQI